MGGLSGPAIKPIALRAVYQAAQAVETPIIGIGGIATIDDVMEFLVAGASAVQLGTVNFYNPKASMEVLDALPAALAEAGATRVADVVGTLVTSNQDRDAADADCGARIADCGLNQRSAIRNPQSAIMRVLSGIQPTGPIHWGNYFGAIRQYIALQDNEQAFYFIANLHALTTVRDRGQAAAVDVRRRARPVGARASIRTRRRCSCSPTCPR